MLRLYHTFRHLRARQIANRIGRKLFPVRSVGGASLEMRKPAGALLQPVSRQRTMGEDSTFRLLTRRVEIDGPEAWNDPGRDMLLTYNLHYFDDLLASDGASRYGVQGKLIDRWVTENPPCQGAGWEPYPASLRIVNWIKWQLGGARLSGAALASLSVQCRFLARSLEWHLMGNHLFANAKALLFAGLFFEGVEADSWLKKSGKILETQVREQFLADGGHFELSPVYHSLMAEDLLDCANMMQTYGRDIPEWLVSTTDKALGWLAVMTGPGGEVPLFNDGANGVSPTPDDLFQYAGRLGNFRLRGKPAAGLTDLAASGYFRYQTGDYVLIGDVGNIASHYNPGHTHNDVFNFQLAVAGRAVIVDTGTSTYEEGALRESQRSTAAHNTVEIAGLEQNELWKSFRVGRRGRVGPRDFTDHSVEAEYDYCAGRNTRHRRRFGFGPKQIEITDELRGGKSGNTATAHLHFAPGIQVTESGGQFQAGPVTLRFEGQEQVQVSSYEYAPEFNKLVEASVVSVRFRKNLTTIISLSGEAEC